MGLFRTLANSLFKPLGYTVIKTASTTRTQKSTIYKYASSLNQTLYLDHGPKALKGPFKGALVTNPNKSAVVSDYAARLLGEYEAEIQKAIVDGLNRKPSAAINVGTSDGYYVSCIRQLAPDILIIGYEISDTAREACRDLMTSDKQLELKGAADPQNFAADLKQHPDALVIMDIEGNETILTELDASMLSQATFIVELHEPAVPGITKRLLEHFSDTHDVSILEQSGRNPFQHSELSSFDSSEKFLLLCEFRGAHQSWLVAVPK
ncbi:hypothetical protein [Roseibium sp.]|uniref:hypothetical protein n=1 Tax=Roseibium sp. TaxID=1936156 RepID=UPI003A96F2B7